MIGKKTLKEYAVDESIVQMKMREIDKNLARKQRIRVFKAAYECERKGDYFWRVGEPARAIKQFEFMLKLAKIGTWKLDLMLNATFKHGTHLALTSYNSRCQLRLTRAKDSLLDFLVL